MKYFVAILFTFIFSIIINSYKVLADDIGNTDKLDKINLEITENSNNDKSLERKNSEEDIFGDEQTFPFVAGLGKNAAH